MIADAVSSSIKSQGNGILSSPNIPPSNLSSIPIELIDPEPQVAPPSSIPSLLAIANSVEHTPRAIPTPRPGHIKSRVTQPVAIDELRVRHSYHRNQALLVWVVSSCAGLRYQKSTTSLQTLELRFEEHPALMARKRLRGLMERYLTLQIIVVLVAALTWESCLGGGVGLLLDVLEETPVAGLISIPEVSIRKSILGGKFIDDAKPVCLHFSREDSLAQELPFCKQESLLQYEKIGYRDIVHTVVARFTTDLCPSPRIKSNSLILEDFLPQGKQHPKYTIRIMAQQLLHTGQEPQPFDLHASGSPPPPLVVSAALSTFTAVADSGTEHDYRYSPLPDCKSYIRLLGLAKDGEEVVGSLKAFPLSEAPDFCALSYAWGTQPPDSLFRCDSGWLTVTDHLLAGMKQVHRLNSTPWIWIDVICISQSDNEEKAGQIPLMDKIYSLAEHVLVWLGEADEDTEQALLHLPFIRDSLQAADPHARLGINYPEMGLPAIDDPIWRALAEFLCRSWFQRLWVLQEVILAKDASFICGNFTLELELLRSSSAEIYHSSVLGHIQSHLLNPKDCQGPATLINIGYMRQQLSASSLDLLSLLDSGRYFRCKEPVDRVYGLLGIMDQRMKREIVVDYSDKARTEYWNLYVSVGKLMVRLGHIEILVTADSKERPPQLPSWVPNWNSDQITYCLGQHFHAGFHTEGDPLTEDALIPKSNNLQLRGFRVGSVVGISALEWKPFKDQEVFGGLEGDAAQRLELLDKAFALYQKFCRQTESILLERFSRTLVADTALHPDTGEYGNYLQDASEDYKWYRKYLSDYKFGRGGPTGTIDELHMLNNAGVYNLNLNSTWRNRSFFVTDSGHIGLCSQSCQPGDKVCIFLSLKYTFVIREVPGGSSVKLISAAYTDGVMYGEALDDRDMSKETFIIS